MSCPYVLMLDTHYHHWIRAVFGCQLPHCHLSQHPSTILTAVHSHVSTIDATSTLHAISWCWLQISSRFKPCNMPTIGTVWKYGGVRLFKSSCASTDASPTSFCSLLHASYTTYATLHSNPDSNSWQSTLQRHPNSSQSDAVAKDLCSRAFPPG